MLPLHLGVRFPPGLANVHSRHEFESPNTYRYKPSGTASLRFSR